MKLGKSLREIDEMDAAEIAEWGTLLDEAPWLFGLPPHRREQTGREIADVFRGAKAQAKGTK